MDPETYINQLREDLYGFRDVIDNALSNDVPNSAAINDIYALLQKTRESAEGVGYGLVTQICSLACGILQRRETADGSTLRAVRAHLDALVIITEHDLDGDGGTLGQEMVCELEGLAKAVSA
ncbi:MAG: hypothetical protein GKS01_10105 [Alphaproteobacteria bacterium]|nr:hypothetical protein [Alphaproteobacteria bacterium]